MTVKEHFDNYTVYDFKRIWTTADDWL
jgi:hypothetical protein